MESIVRVSIAEMPASRRDVKSQSGKTDKLLPGASIGLTPVTDRNLGTLQTGTTREEFKKIMPDGDYDKFYKNFRVRIGSNGKRLDLTEPKHVLIYNLLKVHPWVCLDLDKYNPAIHSVILIDEEAKAEERVKKTDKKMQAYAILHDMSSYKMRNFLYLYGIKADDASDVMIKDKLREKAESDLDRFLSLYNDNSRDDKILLNKLVVHGIIRKNGASYFYGEEGDSIMLGANEELAVEFLKEPKNQELKMALINNVEDKE